MFFQQKTSTQHIPPDIHIPYRIDSPINSILLHNLYYVNSIQTRATIMATPFKIKSQAKNFKKPHNSCEKSLFIFFFVFANIYLFFYYTILSLLLGKTSKGSLQCDKLQTLRAKVVGFTCLQQMQM